MATAKDKTTVTAEIHKKLKTELDRRAGAEGRSKSQIIGRAIRFYLDHAEITHVEDDRPRPKIDRQDT